MSQNVTYALLGLLVAGYGYAERRLRCMLKEFAGNFGCMSFEQGKGGHGRVRTTQEHQKAGNE
jgi:hypothetical protein